MYEFRGKFFLCNEIGHIKRDFTNKSFNHVKDFYCHNCHGMGHKVIDYRKPNDVASLGGLSTIHTMSDFPSVSTTTIKHLH